MSDAGRNPIPFEKFRRLIAEALQVDESRVVPEASFIEDLLADSIKLVEMLLYMEEAGIELPIEEAWNIQTVGDAYQLYAGHARRAGEIRSVPSTPETAS